MVEASTVQSPPPDYSCAAYAAQVEARLQKAQNASRLALHQWEEVAHHAVPRKTLRHLDMPIPDAPPDDHACTSLALLSMTLLPTANSCRSVKPYNHCTDTLMMPGYLFDLSQKRASSPKVVLAGGSNLESGMDYLKKNFDPENPYLLPEMQEKYIDLAADDQLVSHALNHPEHTDQQLDALGKFSSHTHDVGYDALHRLLATNEILVAARRTHIAAVCISVYDRDAYTPCDYRTQSEIRYSQLPQEYRQAFRDFQASIIGLKHLAEGIDEPVVFYHVTPPQQGSITFYGQGKEMLTEKAFQAIEKLQEAGILTERFKMSDIVSHTRQEARLVLGVDVLQPIKKPGMHATASVHHGTLPIRESGRTGLEH